MKIRVTILLLLLPLFFYAQKAKKHKAVAHPVRPGLTAYFAKHDLDLDSVVTPYLYYQVYDWLGTRYKYSGETKKGIDCSGFVNKMYEAVYCTSLSGGSRDIWTKVKPIEKECLQEGDILFFKIKKGQISHVGIYLGNNKFAHASVKLGVIVSDLDEEYYKKHFFMGGRLGDRE